MKKIAITLSCFFVCAVVFCAHPLYGQTKTDQKASMQSENEDAALPEDLDEKIDATIEILSVIKNELKDYEKKQKEKLSAQEEDKTEEEKDEEWTENMKDTTSRIMRIWLKLKEITQRNMPQPEKEKDSAQNAEWSEELSRKLDRTIKAMSVIKEEVNKMEEEIGAQSSQ